MITILFFLVVQALELEAVSIPSGSAGECFAYPAVNCDACDPGRYRCLEVPSSPGDRLNWSQGPHDTGMANADPVASSTRIPIRLEHDCTIRPVAVWRVDLETLTQENAYRFDGADRKFCRQRPVRRRR